MKQSRWDSRNWHRDSNRLLNLDLKESPKKIKLSKKKKPKKKDDSL